MWESERQKERGEEARGEVFFKRKGERCVKSRSSFCHAAVPPAFLALPTLTAYVSLPPIPAPLSIHLPLSLLSHLFDMFSLQSPPVLLFPTLSLLLLSMCVRLCKLSRCLSLSLSDVQQLHKESFFSSLKHVLLSYAPDLACFPDSHFSPAHFFLVLSDGLSPHLLSLNHLYPVSNPLPI